MTCTEAREQIEVADLSDLQESADSPLAAHLVECADCRRLATVVLRGTMGLRVTSARRSHAGRVVRRVAAWSSVAAAATIVAVVVVNRRAPGARPQPARVGSLPVVQHVSLDVARGQQAAVIKTADPTVTVIWLSSGEGK